MMKGVLRLHRGSSWGKSFIRRVANCILSNVNNHRSNSGKDVCLTVNMVKWASFVFYFLSFLLFIMTKKNDHAIVVKICTSSYWYSAFSSYEVQMRCRGLSLSISTCLKQQFHIIFIWSILALSTFKFIQIGSACENTRSLLSFCTFPACDSNNYWYTGIYQ